MKKQSSKQLFAQAILFSLLLNTISTLTALAKNNEPSPSWSTSGKQLLKAYDAYKKCNPCAKEPSCSKEPSCKKKKHKKTPKYDYVIVGAGTAGCVMAYELTNKKKRSVLVLEEGPNVDQDPVILNMDTPPGNNSSQVAAVFPMAQEFRHTYYHEWFTVLMAGTNPGPGLQNRPVLYGGARVAGGTSTTNAQLHIRPSAQVLDNWYNLTGDDHYLMGNTGTEATPNGMTERWVKINTYLPAQPQPELYWHGYGNNPHQINTIFDRQQAVTDGGTLFADLITNFSIAKFGANITPNVDTFPGPSPFAPHFAPGAAFDRNNPNYPFYSTAQVCLEQRSDTTRSHSSREFLLAVNGDAPEFPNKPVVKRDYENAMDKGIHGRDLTVLYDSTVLHIEWDTRCAEAKAKYVTYLRNGVEHKVKVGKKLILCAGINSATILLKNGVGPADQLIKANIPVIFDSPNVGRNIQNHPIVSIALSQAPIDGVVRTVSFRSRLNNSATITLDSTAGLAVGDWINVSGVAGVGYNLNQVQITALNGNDVSYFSLGANEALTQNVTTSTAGAVSSRVIKVDNFRGSQNNAFQPFAARVPYGWDGLGAIDLTKQGKYVLVGSTNGNNISYSIMNPAARGFIRVINQDPLHPVFCDLEYLARPSDVTDNIAIIRQIVNLIDFLITSGNTNYNIQNPSRATIRGTAAPAVVGYQRTAGVATLTLAAQAPALTVGTFVTIGDNIAPTTSMPDASFNSLGAPITRVTNSPAPTISYANAGPDVAFTAINPLAGVVLDQSALVTFIRAAFAQNHHYLGSCQMRDTFENGGVVDPYGNVFGTKNVMVVDASSFPDQTDSNLAGTVYPFALKLAEDLLSGRNPRA